MLRSRSECVFSTILLLGHAGGQYHLAGCFSEGNAVPKDATQARGWQILPLWNITRHVI
jgi:hypothetical protein